MIDNFQKKRYNKCRVEMIFCRDRRPRHPENERLSHTMAGRPGGRPLRRMKKATRFLFNQKPQNLARAIQNNICRGRHPRRPENERFSLTKAGGLPPFVRSSTIK